MNESIMENIYDAKYCVNVRNVTLYLKYFKPLIVKYLADDANYTIYVSTTNTHLSKYQKIWPTNPRLKYISGEYIENSIPTTENAIYFYHRKLPNKKLQMDLIPFINSRPLLKYIFVGCAFKMNEYVRCYTSKYYFWFKYRNEQYR